MVFKKPEFFGEPMGSEEVQDADARLEEQVASALADSGEVDAVGVRVTAIEAGEIFLTGWVSGEGEIDRCGDVARDVAGVSSVRNAIRIRAGTG